MIRVLENRSLVPAVYRFPIGISPIGISPIGISPIVSRRGESIRIYRKVVRVKNLRVEYRSGDDEVDMLKNLKLRRIC